MLSQTQVQIISKATQVILQSRVDVKKTLFSHFQDYLLKLKQGTVKLSNMTVMQFLNQLLPKDFYFIKQKFSIKQHNIKYNQALKVQVIFYLIQRASGYKTEVECWTIELCRKKDISNSSFGIIVEFFKEIIFILNKLPLFSIYQKEKELKIKYYQDYKIVFENLKSYTLIELKAKDLIVRENQAIRISAEICYLPSFKTLTDKKNNAEESKRKISIATSEYEGDRKVSVYAFYDPDLDFTFLSSDDEDFNKKGNSQSIEIRMDIDQVELSEQFQLLIANEDQDFLNDNKEILDSLIKHEKQYLNL